MTMKTLSVDVPDELLDRAERRAAELGTSLRNEVVELIGRYGEAEDDQNLASARTRMEDLFRTVKGFRMTAKIPREELYERGSLR